MIDVRAAASASEAASAARIPSLDRLRGLAVLLMVADHAVLVFAPGWTLGRLTVTRAALPLFCVVSGYLLRGRTLSVARAVKLQGLGVGCSVVGAPLGIGQPDVLILLGIGYVVCVGLERTRWLPVVLVLAIVQPVTWPVPWAGYQPGVVVALLIVGLQLPALRLGDRLPAWLGTVGRYPLSIYCGHLVLLLGVVWAL